jgi:polysaccharide deacetylase family protein (PEP-CTERM system associated)
MSTQAPGPIPFLLKRPDRTRQSLGTLAGLMLRTGRNHTKEAGVRPVNALTIDVEDWHQLAHQKLLGRSVVASPRVVANTQLILDILAEHGARATFFVLGMVAEQFPNLVRRIKDEGHEVATHGFGHRLTSQMGPEAFGIDLRHSIRILEEIIQEPIWGHRAAEFSLRSSSLWALEMMAAEGLRYDSSIFPIWHPRYGIPDAPRHPYLIDTPAGPLAEFPLATLRFLGQNLPTAGGGYLRVFPLTFIRWGIESLNQQGYPAIMYLHPYELDEEWLDLPISTYAVHKWLGLRMRALKRNWQRGRPVRDKLKALLRAYSFAPLCEVMAHGTEWQDPDLLSKTCVAIRPAISTGSPSP